MLFGTGCTGGDGMGPESQGNRHNESGEDHTAASTIRGKFAVTAKSQGVLVAAR